MKNLHQSIGVSVGKYVFFFCLMTVLPASSQTSFLTIKIDKEDIIRSEATFGGFDFELLGGMSASIATDLSSKLTANPEIMSMTVKEISSQLYSGQLRVEKGVNSIKVIHLMMNAGITHIEFNGELMTLKDLRARIRARQAKKH